MIIKFKLMDVTYRASMISIGTKFTREAAACRRVVLVAIVRLIQTPIAQFLTVTVDAI